MADSTPEHAWQAGGALEALAPELGPRFEHALRLPKAFVVGCQKSGTTWLQRILEAHPEICCRGESCIGVFLPTTLAKLAVKYNGFQRAGPLNTLGESEISVMLRTTCLALFTKWLKAEPDDARIRLIAEKTPEHVMVLQILDVIFPACKIVHIIRDGRDGVVSGWHHNIRENESQFRERFPTMAAYAAYFAESHWVPYIRLAQAWGAERRDRYHEIRYEELLADPQRHTTGLLEFLGVDASDGIAARCAEAASFESLTGRSRGQANNSSHYRKGVAGDWKRSLDAESLKSFIAHGGEMLRELGYETAA